MNMYHIVSGLRHLCAYCRTYVVCKLYFELVDNFQPFFLLTNGEICKCAKYLAVFSFANPYLEKVKIFFFIHLSSFPTLHSWYVSKVGENMAYTIQVACKREILSPCFIYFN